jgi:hypothetical protein
LALWLVGLGIAPIWNAPCHPTQNAQVERTNGTVNRWGEPARCADFAAWEDKLAWAARVQREEYPSIQGQSRQAAYPELRARPRPYEREREAEQWHLARVTAYLAQGKWPRQVSQRGQISAYGQPYEVGRAHGGQTVWLRFDAVAHEWVIEGREGQELRRHPAAQITAERVRGLTVSKPHASSQKRSPTKEGPPNVTLRYAA